MEIKNLDGLPEFNARVNDVCAWAETKWGHHDLMLVLRSPDLKPEFLGSKKDGEWPTNTASLIAAVDRISVARRSKIKKSRDLTTYLHEGKLLVYRPYACVYDGASQNVSHGYFDTEDCPPWDTWVWAMDNKDGNDYKSMVILSWVPPEFISLVNFGIDSCLGALSWADDA